VRVTQRLLRIYKFYFIECLEAEDSLKLAQKYCNELCMEKDLKSTVFKNKKRFEYLPVEEKLIILKICYKIFEDFKEFVEIYKKELHLTREVLFKHWNVQLNFLLNLFK